MFALLQADAGSGLGLIGAGISIGLTVIGAGIGIGQIGAQMAAGIARQPEAAGTKQQLVVHDFFGAVLEHEFRHHQPFDFLFQDRVVVH